MDRELILQSLMKKLKTLKMITFNSIKGKKGSSLLKKKDSVIWLTKILILKTITKASAILLEAIEEI